MGLVSRGLVDTVTAGEWDETIVNMGHAKYIDTYTSHTPMGSRFPVLSKATSGPIPSYKPILDVSFGYVALSALQTPFEVVFEGVKKERKAINIWQDQQEFILGFHSREYAMGRAGVDMFKPGGAIQICTPATLKDNMKGGYWLYVLLTALIHVQLVSSKFVGSSSLPVKSSVPRTPQPASALSSGSRSTNSTVKNDFLNGKKMWPNSDSMYQI